MSISEISALIMSFFGKSSTVHPKGNACSLYGFRKICLGSNDQTVLIRTANIMNPIILFLHGGPGSPELPQAVKLSRELESNFTVVVWDQRGCGKSYNKNEGITISKEQIIDDAIELVQYLKNKYDKEKIILIGHSWGTIISMNVINRIPDDIDFYVSIGQVVDFKRNEEISYNHLLDVVKRANDKKSLKTLIEIQAPVEGLYNNTIKSLMKQRKLLLKYGCVYYGKKNASEIVKMIFTAPEYTLLEKLRYGKNQISIMKKIWNQDLMATDFITQIPMINVPICFVVGISDYNTPAELVAEYYDKLSAPLKKIALFDKSGHDPHVEETKRFAQTVIGFFYETRSIKHPSFASI